MSSAETLNFGPQWLRDLSEGSANSTTGMPSQTPQAPSKFKLADYRYGREEMLALFVDESEVPDELHRAPSLISEIIQIPLALRPSSEHSQGQPPTSFRGRGGISSGIRGRSITSRGRGRGRGSAWADHDDSALRRPPLRRSESEDWRSDSLRGKGDGAEDIMNGLKEWRVSGQRGGNDFWKDAWRDRQDEVKEQRYPRGRSLSSWDAEDSDRRWRDGELNGLNGKQTEIVGSGEESKTKETKENDKDHTEDVSTSAVEIDSHRISQTDATQLEKLESRLEPLQECHEGTGTSVAQPTAGAKVLEKTDPLPNKAVDPNPMDDMFRKLSMNDESHNAAHGITGHPIIQQEFQVSKPDVGGKGDTEPSQMSTFSSNLNLPAVSHSSVAQPQALPTTWYYKDPQGDIQGPFSSNQMLEWFHAGYFTMVLLVKRSCDTCFVPLGDLIDNWGRIPFTASAKNPFALDQNLAAATTGQQMHYIKLGQDQQAPSPIQTQAPIGSNPRAPQQNSVEVILEKLLKNPEFCQLPPIQKKQVLMQLAAEQQSLAGEPASASTFPNLHGGASDSSIVQTESLLHQKMLEDARRKEEERIRMIQKQQEEQKELLKRQEEEFRRKKEMLMMEQEEIKKLEEEARRKKEQLQREIEEDLKRKKLQELQELEQRKRMEEERRRQQDELKRRQAEERRIQQEAEERRRMEEEQRRLEEARRIEMVRQEELRRLEIEKEEQRIAEERKRQEESDRELAREAEMQRRAEAVRLQKEKEEAAKALVRKQQQEKQMQQIQLPSHAKWGHSQLTKGKSESLSLIEIQKLEKEQEKTRIKEEARMARENRHQSVKPKAGWGSASRDIEGVSLLDIQMEEAREMSKTKQTVPVIKPEISKPANFGSSWSKPPKIQPDIPKPQNKPQPSFWDQVVEEHVPKKQTVAKPSSSSQQQVKHVKQQKGAKQKTKGDEGQQVKALFQQQISKDRFTEWCENYLKKINVGSIDIPTFVNFLRDVESPYEVQEYVQSYLGESKEARDFTSLFLEQRAKLGKPQDSSSKQILSKPQAATACDTDGFEIVTSNTKRGKKKLRKLQKVDPSILGFSVNAASDRVNMGEIQTADD